MRLDIVTSLATRVDAALTTFLKEEGEALVEIDPVLAPVVDSATDLVLRGGKRLRPVFTYWGAQAAGGGDDERIVRAASALELLHGFALVHDDVMDRSATRRGGLSVHRQFGDDHFGLSAAILVGDLLLVWADRMLDECGLPPEKIAAGRLVYNEMRLAAIAGQYLDIYAERNGAAVETALRIARYKSASYTIWRPLELGAALAVGEVSPELAVTFQAYGEAVGEAFQLRDDLLGVFGDPAKTGKPAGDDLLLRKPTVLYALALDRGNARLLRESTDVAELAAEIAACGAKAEVETMISVRLEKATAAVAELDSESREVLLGLAQLATQRSV